MQPEAHGRSRPARRRGPRHRCSEGARLAVRLRRTRARHLDRLRAGLDPSVPMLLVPMLFTRGYGMRTTRQIARTLSEELGLLMARSDGTHKPSPDAPEHKTRAATGQAEGQGHPRRTRRAAHSTDCSPRGDHGGLRAGGSR